MSMELDRICTVDISLATPISDNSSFDNILILGKAQGQHRGCCCIQRLGRAHRSRRGCRWRKR